MTSPIARGEDNRRQFKQDVTNADALAAEMAAFANSIIRDPILVSYIAKGLLPYRGLGSGIKRALEDWPEIEFSDDYDGCLFTATVHRKALISGVEIETGSEKSSPKTEEQIIALIKQDATISTDQIGKILGISKRAVVKQIQKLKTMRGASHPRRILRGSNGSWFQS